MVAKSAPLPNHEERAVTSDDGPEVNKMAQPIWKCKAGAVRAALWQNETTVNGRTVRMLKATVERRFKDPKTDSWRSSNSLSRNEIPLAIHCLRKAFEAMIDEANAQGNNGVEEETVM